MKSGLASCANVPSLFDDSALQARVAETMSTYSIATHIEHFTDGADEGEQAVDGSSNDSDDPEPRP